VSLLLSSFCCYTTVTRLILPLHYSWPEPPIESTTQKPSRCSIDQQQETNKLSLLTFEHQRLSRFARASRSDLLPLQANEISCLLQNTLNYLFTTLLGEDPDLKATHSFIRDRTRSIRQDFSVQSEKSDISIECHERMARYHIHALHVLCATEGFSVQQEMEQMKKGSSFLLLPSSTRHLDSSARSEYRLDFFFLSSFQSSNPSTNFTPIDEPLAPPPQPLPRLLTKRNSALTSSSPTSGTPTSFAKPNPSPLTSSTPHKSNSLSKSPTWLNGPWILTLGGRNPSRNSRRTSSPSSSRRFRGGRRRTSLLAWWRVISEM